MSDVGHGGVVHVLSGSSANTNVSDSSAWYGMQCGHCGNRVSGAVVAWINRHDTVMVRWLRCTICHLGSVENNFVISPPTAGGEPVEGLPDDVGRAYAEARACLTVGAYTACELMCRKILMHVAVAKGAEEGESFADYVTYIQGEGYITPPMVPWVDEIRRRGNLATHEIPAVERQRAEGTLTFTAQLLRLVYEMEHKLRQQLPPA